MRISITCSARLRNNTNNLAWISGVACSNINVKFLTMISDETIELLVKVTDEHFNDLSSQYCDDVLHNINWDDVYSDLQERIRSARENIDISWLSRLRADNINYSDKFSRLLLKNNIKSGIKAALASLAYIPFTEKKGISPKVSGILGSSVVLD